MEEDIGTIDESGYGIDPGPNRDERMWGMACHISTFFGWVFPLGNIIAPLVIWLIKKEESEFIADQGKEALNFQISLMIYMIISAILVLVIIGIPMLIGLVFFDFVVTIIAAVRAADGVRYQYPATMRLVK